MQLTALIGFVATSLALACSFYWRARYHEAKAEVYQEFADTFTEMGWHSFTEDEQRKKAEQRRAWMRLTLCDPVCADALREALADADEHWERLK